MKNKILFEICVDSLESSLIGQNNGADRIELCSDLLEGGITPSAGLIDLVCKNIKIPIMVIVRPRGGDFLYSDYEFEVMNKEIEFIKTKNVQGIVIGILNADGTVDKKRTKELIGLAHPLEITFHRAFDMTIDPFKALDDLLDIGVNRILTSGQKINAFDGIELIKDLVKKCGDRISIMPGGGINENNAAEIVKKCGVREIHASARVVKKSQMQHNNFQNFMNIPNEIPGYEIMAASAERIRAIKENIELNS